MKPGLMGSSKKPSSSTASVVKACLLVLGATIHFADEAAMTWDYHSGTTWAPKGQTPAVGARPAST